MSGAVGSAPSLTRNGFPVFADFSSLARNSFSGIISIVPLRRYASCSSIVIGLVCFWGSHYHAPSDLFIFSAHDQSDRFRIQLVFLLENPSGKSFFRVGIQHGHDSLSDDGSAVQRVINKVDRASAPLCAMLKRLKLGIETRKRRKQARMDVENSSTKSLHKTSRQQTHITCQADQIRFMFS